MCAELEAADGNGHTPLEAALFAGDTEAVRRLQAVGARPPAPAKPVAAVNLAELAADFGRGIAPVLRVPDVGAALAWYVSLGFRENGRREDGGVFYWASLSLGEAELILYMGGAVADPPVTLWFRVARAAAIHDVLKARQLAAVQSANGHTVEFVEHLHEPFYGGREFTIRDPNGYSLTFLGPE